MRPFDLLIFGALAGSVHVGTWIMIAPQTPSDQAGTRGAPAPSIAGAPNGAALLVARWQNPPEIASDVTAKNAPATPTAMPPVSAKRSPKARLAPVPQTTKPTKDAAAAKPETARPAPKTFTQPEAKTAARPTLPQHTHTGRAPQALHMPERPRTDASDTPPAIEIIAPPPTGPLIQSKRPRMTTRLRPEQAQPPVLPAQDRKKATQPPKGAGLVTTADRAPQAKKGVSAGQIRSAKARWSGQIRSRILRGVRAPEGITGPARVGLRLHVSRSGKLLDYGVTHSSGQAALDKAARKAVSRARRFAKAPAALPDATYTFDIQLRFE